MTDELSSPWRNASDEAKRTLILDAALRVFGEGGFVKPTMDDVAVEAGYARRSLYRFYQSKDEIGVALALRTCKRMILAMEPLESKSLLDIVWVYYRMSRDDPRGFRVILETREWLGCDAPLPQRDELAAVDSAFLEILRSRMTPLTGEPVCAAVGYVEFLFRHKAMLPVEDPVHRDQAVRTMLEKLLPRENP